MHGSVRTYQAVDAEKFLEKLETECLDRVQTIDGVIGYYVIDTGNGTVTTITLGETAQAIEDSVRIAQSWVVESASHLVGGRPDVTAGEIRVRGGL